jgi:hypothetical protein
MIEETEMPERVKVILYSKPGCHLCEQSKEAMQAAGCSDLFTIEEINIETDPELNARYRYDIPVILINGTEAFRHRLLAEEFRQEIFRHR